MWLVPDDVVQQITASGTPRSAGPRSPSTSTRAPRARSFYSGTSELMIDTFGV